MISTPGEQICTKALFQFRAGIFKCRSFRERNVLRTASFSLSPWFLSGIEKRGKLKFAYSLDRLMSRFKDYLPRIAVGILVGIVAALCSNAASGQTARDRHQSERSDKLTGGHIARGEFQPGEPDIRLTLNVPSFRLTLWQNGREVKSYFVGVGMRNYPIYIGDREATEVIWNPPWIPPASDWVAESSKVRAGEIIRASDPRNPLGKLKIPLGDSYLIHQAAKPTDLGNLVSHGCVRMLRSDLYDLAAKIIATRDTGISRQRIEAAKRNSKTLTVPLNEPVPVDINYDTIVIEARLLHIYPDVYERGTNTVAEVLEELKSASVEVSRVDRSTIQQMLTKVTPRAEFVVKVESIEQGRALEDGQVLPLIPPRRREKAKGKKENCWNRVKAGAGDLKLRPEISRERSVGPGLCGVR
jgi:hypothetical protein